ncbi:hypothetical protein [Bradyrhizobium sp. DASA03007]|uniref:hypothetical protein n=1 Tax=unclassified Bradyrhizobium TaxID=2631580 RepID=UPI003F704106
MTDTDYFASRFKLVIDRSSEMTRGYILSFENAEAKNGGAAQSAKICDCLVGTPKERM